MRWLASRGRLEEGDAIVARVAAMNGVQVTETLVNVAKAQKALHPETVSGILRIPVYSTRTVPELEGWFCLGVLLIRIHEQ